MSVLLFMNVYSLQSLKKIKLKPKKQKQVLPLEEENKLIWDQALKFRQEKEEFQKLAEKAVSQEQAAIQQLEKQVDENRRLCEIHGSLMARCQKYSKTINQLESVNKRNESKIKELEQLLKQQNGQEVSKSKGAADDKKEGDNLSSNLDVCSVCHGKGKAERD